MPWQRLVPPRHGLVLDWGKPRDQPIAALRDCLDEARLPGIIAEGSSQFRDGARQHVVADERVGPHRTDQALLGDDLVAVLGQAPQDVHHLGLEAHRAGGSPHAVERRFDEELANSEVVWQGSAPCGFDLAAFYRSGLRSLSAAPLAAPSVEGAEPMVTVPLSFANRQNVGYVFPSEKWRCKGDRIARVFDTDPTKPIGGWKVAWTIARRVAVCGAASSCDGSDRMMTLFSCYSLNDDLPAGE